MSRPLIIAEAGVHHGCDRQRGFALIEAAARAGADAIKFQTYRAERIVTCWAPRYWDCGEAPGTQFDTFLPRGRFGPDDYLALAEHCRRQGIMFLSTPFDIEVVDWLEQCGMAMYKIASADLTNYPLLKRVAVTGRPILLSTGASTGEEIKAAVDFIRQQGGHDLTLLHCCLAYPAPYDGLNLKKIITLRELFPDCRVGYSDHTIPDQCLSACLGAVALGAEVIEKHFTLDRSLPEDDHYHALDEQQLGQLVEGVAHLTAALGSGQLQPAGCEQPARLHARRSIVAARDLPAGTVLEWEHLDFKRPGHGIPPSQVADVTGRVLNRDLQRDQLVTWDCLQ
ncbi:MAG: N-acetylneuraminate synthase family protein [Negativicutes bacterium]|nr:N-acetylneuraminate synthase family protein [Negativicutes bacterium]